MSQQSTPLLSKSALAAIRSTLIGLVVVAVLGVGGAVVSYRADVREAQMQVAERVERSGALYADSLALHFDVLGAELKELADDPMLLTSEVDPQRLRVAHDGDEMFGAGVALLDLDGRVRWSEPKGVLDDVVPVKHQPWFQQALVVDGVAVDTLDGSSPRLALATPVVREGREVAMLVGLVDANDKLFFGDAEPGEHVLVLGANGKVILPPAPPWWAREPGFPALVERLVRQRAAARETVGDKPRFVYATRIGESQLKVLLVTEEEGAIAPIRARLVPQLLFLTGLQIVTLGVFALFLRRQYRASVRLEAAFAQREKMAALGQAASLIAHEVKNALNGLNTAAQLVESGGDIGVASRTLRGQVDRLKHLASSLLSFASPAHPRQVPLRANEIAREAAQGLLALPELADVSLEARLETPVDAVGDPLLLVTALDNLLRNAIEAAVAARDIGARTHAKVRVTARSHDGAAIVEVEDEAGGPPPGFEQTWGAPFSTTKSKGIGLGLAMARRAIEEQGGRLVFTRTTQGSLFTVQLKGA